MICRLFSWWLSNQKVRKQPQGKLMAWKLDPEDWGYVGGWKDHINHVHLCMYLSIYSLYSFFFGTYGFIHSSITTVYLHILIFTSTYIAYNLLIYWKVTVIGHASSTLRAASRSETFEVSVVSWYPVDLNFEKKPGMMSMMVQENT